MITRKQIEDSYNLNNKSHASFIMRTDWQHTGILHLNDLIDDHNEVEDGCFLCDISYEPVKLVGDEIFYRVIVNDLSEYLDEDNKSSDGIYECE